LVIKWISLKNFRNIKSQTLQLGERFNIISGQNAQGKTNFLEAIYFLATLRSFRARRNEEMIQLSQEECSLRAAVRARDIERQLEVQIGAGKKRVKVDGKPVRSATGYLGNLNAVLFTPEDLQIPRGAPRDRRFFLDGAILTIWPAYADLIKDYQRVLQSRNNLLKKKPDQWNHLIEVYEQQLAKLGAKIVAGRVRYLRSISQTFEEVFKRVFAGVGKGTLSYCSSKEVIEAGDNVGVLTEVLERQLERKRSVDIARQVTTIGPHVDDLDFEIDGKTTRCFGSQGQVRALVLTFKIVQIYDSFKKTGSYAALLLDDVSSELDSVRTQCLFELIEEIPSQVFLTTTRADWISIRRSPENRVDLQVSNGVFSH
jgi:DNA replication and repair protein RecF